LLDHVIDEYYPNLKNEDDKYALFYAELVKRVAELVAQWMAAGFCHAVLNTDNMSITGESFDYGPYAFIPSYDLYFTAAYFDYYRRYCYGQQPSICHLNLELLQEPLKAIIDLADLHHGLGKFAEYYHLEYRNLMLKKLGFEDSNLAEGDDLLDLTVSFLKDSQINYHQFFADMAQTFSMKWRDEPALVMNSSDIVPSVGSSTIFDNWCLLYHKILNNFDPEQMQTISQTLAKYNPQANLLRPVIESIWQPIVESDNWQPFYDLVKGFQ
jgi:uncharacterized protein YdiU (UPF0061 family)